MYPAVNYMFKVNNKNTSETLDFSIFELPFSLCRDVLWFLQNIYDGVFAKTTYDFLKLTTFEKSLILVPII